MYYSHQDPQHPAGDNGGFQNYHSNDLMRSLHPEVVGDEDAVEVEAPPSLEDLSLDIYKDADLPHRLPPKLLHYNEWVKKCFICIFLFSYDTTIPL